LILLSGAIDVKKQRNVQNGCGSKDFEEQMARVILRFHVPAKQPDLPPLKSR
jgi:hypothetical protein